MRGRTSAWGWERSRDHWWRWGNVGFTWRILHKINFSGSRALLWGGGGEPGWSQTRAYLKLILHLHATFSLIHCHSGSQKPSSAFFQASCAPPLPPFGPHQPDELNITATWKFMSWKSTDGWSGVRSLTLYLAWRELHGEVIPPRQDFCAHGLRPLPPPTASSSALCLKPLSKCRREA